ncbi:hypothetical protein ACFWAK_12675 [Streptomyces sp. NPDC059918]|uniref:hypothetical protein n=1 Tax=Streptomyces sp. NPDC059918 TaxID=3347003 RepID=UPI00365B4C3C
MWPKKKPEEEAGRRSGKRSRKRSRKKSWRAPEATCYGDPVPADERGTDQFAHDPEVSSLMTVVAQGAARIQKTINVTSVVSG